MKRATDRPYINDDMIHSLLDLLQIETTEYQVEKSIFIQQRNDQ